MSFAHVNIPRKCAVNIVFCIDATKNMANVINIVKRFVFKSIDTICEAMEGKGLELEHWRAKVITFRDFSCDEEALICSPFYTLPDERRQFEDCVNGIEARGGNGKSANALEALAVAMNSEWTSERMDRHFIVLITESGAINLEDSIRSHKKYPEYVPTCTAELENWWYGGTPNGKFQIGRKRLIMFVPNMEPWNKKDPWWEENLSYGPVFRSGSPITLGNRFEDIANNDMIWATAISFD